MTTKYSCEHHLVTTSDRLFSGGSPDYERFGFFSLRSSAGRAPDFERIAAAAERLGREAFFKDETGCEHEIIGAAVDDSGQIAYVESRTRDAGPHPHGYGGRHIDVSIRVHHVDVSGSDRSVEIESYNPIFWVRRAIARVDRPHGTPDLP